MPLLLGLIAACSGGDDATTADGPGVLSLASWNDTGGIGRCAYDATTLEACDSPVYCDLAPIPGQGAGDISISDGVYQLVFVLQDGVYVTNEVAPTWASSELTVSAPGADIPGFSVTRPAPTTLTVTSPESRAMHPTDQPLEVVWSGEATDFVVLQFGTHDGLGGSNTRSCLIDGGAQTYTLTPDDLAFLGVPDDDVQICAQGIVTNSTMVGEWLVEASNRTSGICKNIQLVAP